MIGSSLPFTSQTPEAPLVRRCACPPLQFHVHRGHPRASRGRDECASRPPSAALRSCVRADNCPDRRPAACRSLSALGQHVACTKLRLRAASEAAVLSQRKRNCEHTPEPVVCQDRPVVSSKGHATEWRLSRSIAVGLQICLSNIPSRSCGRRQRRACAPVVT